MTTQACNLSDVMGGIRDAANLARKNFLEVRNMLVVIVNDARSIGAQPSDIRPDALVHSDLIKAAEEILKRIP